MTHTRESISALLETSNKAVERALVVLFERQTPDEQTSETTHVYNAQGFNGTDAQFYSSLAKRIIENRYGMPEGQRLSANMLAALRKRNKNGRMAIAKYAGQLAAIANEKAAAAAAAA